MDDLLVWKLRSSAAGADTKEDAELFDAAADLIEQQAACIAALESERATLLHDVEIHAQEAIYAHAKVEAMEKGAEPIYQAGWPTPETVWGDVPKEAYDNYAQLAYTRRRIVYALPPSQPDVSPDDERVAFETWASDSYGDDDDDSGVSLERRDDGYLYTGVNDAWNGWEARAAMANQKQAG